MTAARPGTRRVEVRGARARWGTPGPLLFANREDKNQMSVVIRIIGLASGAPSMNAGQYLQSFDAEAHGGRGEIMCTPVLTQAMRFDHAGQAHAFWKQSP